MGNNLTVPMEKRKEIARPYGLPMLIFSPSLISRWMKVRLLAAAVTM